MRVLGPVLFILRKKGTEAFHVSPNATVYDAMKMMADKDVGALLVMEGDRLEGILSERDYARKIILQGRSSMDTLCRDIMTEPMTTITPDTSVDEAMRLMTNNRTRHLPVLCEGKVHGVVSIGDLVQWIAFCQDQTIEQLEHYIEGKYPC